jgi:hypothetical protein
LPVSHPENASQVFVDLPRAMTLRAAGEKLSHLGLLDATEHELIGATATTGARLSMHIPANGSNLPLLLEHGLPSNRQVKLVNPILLEKSIFENTEDVGGTRPKGGDLESEAEWEAEAGLPGGSRDLLSLQGGHAGNDTSAHLH